MEETRITMDPRPLGGYGPREITVNSAPAGGVVVGVEDNSSVAIVQLDRERTRDLIAALQRHSRDTTDVRVEGILGDGFAEAHGLVEEDDE